MEWTTFFFASYEVLISLVFSLLTIFITKKIIDKLLIKGDKEEVKHNIALSIFTGSLIICVLLLVNSSILPAVDTLRVMVLATEVITAKMVGLSFLYFLLYFAIAVFFSIVILILTVKVFFKATGWVDEMKEMRSKNIAVSIVVSMVVIGITLFVQPSLDRFIGSLIHYEKFEAKALYDNEQNKEQDEMVVPLEQVEPK